MEKLRKSKVRGYLLYDSLIAFFLVITVVHQLLVIRDDYMKVIRTQMRKLELLNLGHMALQSNRSSITLNNRHITVEQSEKEIHIREGGRVVLSVKVKD